MYSVLPSELSSCNSDSNSTSSSLQSRSSAHNVIDPSCRMNSELIREILKQRSNTTPIKKKLKELDEHGVHS